MKEGSHYNKYKCQESVESHRKASMKIAKELGYGSNVIEMIRGAKTGSEIVRIMGDARRGLYRGRA